MVVMDQLDEQQLPAATTQEAVIKLNIYENHMLANCEASITLKLCYMALNAKRRSDYDEKLPEINIIITQLCQYIAGFSNELNNTWAGPILEFSEFSGLSVISNVTELFENISIWHVNIDDEDYFTHSHRLYTYLFMWENEVHLATTGNNIQFSFPNADEYRYKYIDDNDPVSDWFSNSVYIIEWPRDIDLLEYIEHYLDIFYDYFYNDIMEYIIDPENYVDIPLLG